LPSRIKTLCSSQIKTSVYAIVVDAKNDRAVEFYERYGFRAFASDHRRLFLPLETFEKLRL